MNAIPEETLAAIEPFCAGDATAKLPTSEKYKVTWYADKNKSEAAETDLTKLEGKTDAYSYWYTLTDESETTNCESDPVEYKFTVKPAATVTTAVTYDCDESVVTATATPAGATVTWTIDGTANAATGASLTIDNVSLNAGSYVAVATAEGYCESQPSAALEVKFYETPAAISGTSPEYLKTEGTPNYDLISVSGNEAGLDVYWSNPVGPTAKDEKATQTAPASGYTTSRTNPTPNLSNTDDEFFYYWIYQERVITENGKSCQSEKSIVVVPILGAPSPIVRDTVYCLNSENAVSFKAGKNVEINQAKAGVTYELVFKEAGITEDSKPDVTKVGETTYEVAQRDAANPSNISAYRSFTVKVIGVDKPTTDGNTPAYCAGAPATPVVAQKKDNNANYMYADALVWSENGTEKSSAPTPNTDVTETTTYSYSVYQTYTIPTSGELCKGEAVDFDVKVTYVPQLTTSQVTYLKADATGSTFAKNLVQQNADVYTGADAAATINWYASDGTTCGTTALGGTPTPSIDPAVGTGKDQEVYYCVSQTIDGCEGEPQQVKVVISDAPAPKVAPVVYCEGAVATALTAEINELTNTADKYELTWYDENHTKIGATAPTPKTEMRAGETQVSEYKYYVTQTLKATGAESTESELKVTVYANPVLSITDPATVCSQPVDLKAAAEVVNKVAGQSYADAYYGDAAGTTALASTTVTETGTYYVRYEYTPAAGQTCQSDVKGISVKIDELTMTSADVKTCPDMSAKFAVDAVANNGNAITYEWTGTNGNTDANADKSSAEFETRAFTGANYGDEFGYHLKVTAGTCSEEGDYKVTLGEGPVEGTLTISDPDNKEVPTKEYTNSLTDAPYYYCGGDVTVVPGYKLDPNTSFTLTTPGGISKEGTTFTVSEAGEYKIAFSNGCPTSAKFTLVNSAINITPLPAVLEMCEGETFDAKLTVTNNEAYDVAWYKDNALVNGATGASYTIADTKGTDSGVYSAKATSNGCESEAEIGALKVKTYIQVTNQTEPYIVVRGESVSIPLTITEPSSGTVASVSWTESGSETYNGKTNTLTSVDADHKYDIILSDPDHCNGTTTAEVWVDAKLELTTDFKDTICYEESHEFTIDTTGTGRFRSTPAGTIKVYEKANGATTDITSQFTSRNGKLVASLSPRNDATYTVTFDYSAQNQNVEATESVVVLQPIEVVIPAAQTVCAGEEATIALTKVAPEGTTIVWDDDASITSGLEGESITVTAKYGEGYNHKSEYAYGFTASYAGCETKHMEAKLNVDEPLTGEVTSNAPICSGTSIKMDATSYEAETYTWMKIDSTSEMSGSLATMRLTQPTTFLLHMTRGTCVSDTVYKAEVTENPTIERVDSVDIRSRRIVVTGGTPGYYYSVDNKESDVLDTKIDLTFTSHIAYVVDANGCADTMPFYMAAPPVVVPNFFTPNGDDENDRWVPTNLKEVYPDALVTIFDRYGKKLAQYRAAEEDWDGTYNGKLMPSTDYWYEIDIEEIDKQYVGHFTLLRR